MNKNWLTQLKTDPIPVLLSSGDEALYYFVRRDLLDESVRPASSIWDLRPPQKLLSGQLADGSWKQSGKKKEVYPPYHYSLVETFKRFRLLVERYQFNREYPAIARAAEYIFSCQTPEGDIRGMIGNQYATYYTGYILSLLINAGYTDDQRVKKGMKWLLSMRQDDGGWAVPILTHKLDGKTMLRVTSQYAEPFEPDRSQQFSHNSTNMVLQAFAAHPLYRNSEEARAAATLMKSRFFKPDFYSSYRSPGYWVRFVFWWPNLLTAMKSLALLGFTAEDVDITVGLDWFISHQKDDGLWDVSNKIGNKGKSIPGKPEERHWLSLEISRLLRQYLE